MYSKHFSIGQASDPYTKYIGPWSRQIDWDQLHYDYDKMAIFE